MRHLPFASAIAGLLLAAACGDNLHANQAPTIAAQAVTTAEDTPLTITVPATDPEGDAVTYQVTAPAHGTITGTAPDLTYTPAPDFHGDDSVLVRVSDGAAEAMAAITITVTPVNDPPVAGDDERAGTEDVEQMVLAATLLANDSDVDGDALTITGVAGATHGAVALVDDMITFTPEPNFGGDASFTYDVSDGAATATATVTLHLGAQNDPPVATGDAATTDEDVALTLMAAALLGNDTDLDGDTLDVTAVGDATGGTVALSGGVVVFTPTANFNGAAGFTYTVSDGAATDTATVAVTVTPVNDLPVTVADAAATDEDLALTLPAATLLANDSDVDGDALTITGVTAGTGGAVALAGTDVVFTPTADFNGAAGFTYSVSDGTATVTGAVVITVAPLNDAPIVVADAATTAEDVVLTLPAAALLANDSDVDGDALTITAVSGAAGGAVALAGATITFTPSANFNGAAGFSYTVSDGTSAVAGTVAVTVTPVNDPPVAVADSATTDEDLALTLPAATLLANDSDVDGDSLSITGVTAGTGGTVALAGTDVVFTPAANFNGPAAFTYTLSDGTTTAAGAVAVQVTAVNDPPLAGADAATTAEDVALTVPVATLLGNDSDADGDALSITGVTAGAGGTVALAGTDVVFTPTANFNGAAGFTYTVSDGTVASTGAVAVAVTPVNDAPVAVADAAGGYPNQPLVLAATTLTANDLDVDGDVLTVTAVANPTNGTVALTGGVVTFTPTADFEGAAGFDYTISDGALTATAAVSLTIAPPVCGDGLVAGGEVCDDGNTIAGDGCRADCAGFEVCGDGITDFATGEECDDGNTDPTDDCDACLLPEVVDQPPRVVSVASNCTTAASNTGRKIASDGGANFFVVLRCGRDVYVASTPDRGATWNPPVAVGITADEVAIEGGGVSGTVYVAAVSGGSALFVRSTDGGATWEAPVVLGPTFDAEVSIDALDRDVYVAVSNGPIEVFASHDLGSPGSWTSALVDQSNVFHDVIIDKVSGTIVIGSDDPSFYLSTSTDLGATFSAPVSAAGLAYFSDWTASNGNLYVVGTSSPSDNIDVIPLANPGAAYEVPGIANINTSQARAIDADPLGNAYVVSQLDDGTVQLDRMLLGAAAVDAADLRNYGPGTFPGVAALPNSRGAVVVFTRGTEVLVAVEAY
ncbi:MAG: tandem-95 repeat protein [Kofleriaceae bacterium]